MNLVGYNEDTNMFEHNLEITSEIKFKEYLKKLNIDVDSYNYDTSMDEDYLINHPWVMRNRMYYDNPNLWRLVFDKNLTPAIKFLMNDNRVSDNNLGICNTCLYSNRDEVYELCQRHIESLTDEHEKSIDMDNFLWILVQQNKVDKLKKMIWMAETLGVKPVHETWGNIAYGDALTEAVKFESNEMFDLLMKYDPSPMFNESMPFCIATKYGFYNKALQLVNKGFDLHAMRDLGLKMIQRNDKAGFKTSKTEEFAKRALLKLYNKK